MPGIVFYGQLLAIDVVVALNRVTTHSTVGRVNLVFGNDTVLGGPGRDILEPQRGEDNVDGGDDDQIIGSEGNDTLAGGDGTDFILGDNGQILRAYNADGSPQINENGIWHRDIELPWGDIVSSLYFGGETIDPNSDLWATFGQEAE